MIIATTSTFSHSLEHIIGFIIVMVVLTMLWGLTALIGLAFKGAAVQAPAKVAAAQMAAPGAAATPGELEEEEVAAIAATVTMLMGRRSRIVSIRSGAKDWSREGRREHFASHKIR